MTREENLSAKENIPEQHQGLWQRIKNYQFDDPDHAVPYSQKLALQQGWSQEFTELVIDEFRKFAFIAVVNPNNISPSRKVDWAWHLWMLYSERYWKDWCAHVLEQELHHYPSGGSIREKAQLRVFYKDSLGTYRQYFGEPPANIW